ncbi:hypothetical protein D3C74_215510 [compost metagenome]
MPEAYFAKVDTSINFGELFHLIHQQKENSRKKIKFNSLKEIYIDKNQFEYLKNNISISNPSYAFWGSQSVPDNKGIWNCITIKCDTIPQVIIVYTGGRTFPLYISIS